MSVYEQIFQIAGNLGWTPDAVLIVYWILAYALGIHTVVLGLFLGKILFRVLDHFFPRADH